MSDEMNVKIIGGGTVDLIALLRPIFDRVAALESELAEARNLGYKGVWRSNSIYNRGNLCTHSGSLWIAETTTDAKPGTPDSGWKMVAKGGK